MDKVVVEEIKEGKKKQNKINKPKE